MVLSVIHTLLERRSLITIAVVLITSFLITKFLGVGTRPKDLPPGPPTLPIIGNLHQLPRKNIHVQYQKWAAEYGPIFSLKPGQQTTIVLADGYVIRDFVDQRGANYADRPNLWVHELFEHSRIIMRGYDQLWRLERKLYHALLNINTAHQYLPYQELESLKMLVDIVADPAEFVSSIGRMTGSIAASITYGIRLADKDSPRTHELLENSHGFFTCIVQSQYMDWFPSLRPFINWLPHYMNPMAKSAIKAYASEKANFKKYYELGSSGHMPCFARDIAAAQRKWQGSGDGEMLTDHAASYIAGISFEGGADTTRYTLQGFIKAMAMFPETQRKGQAEIDSIAGSDELPSAEHLSKLRYVNGMAKETIRWMPTAINGAIPHAARGEDTYRGLRIPKGSTIVLAVWPANHDERDFPDARMFNPDRQMQDTSLFESATRTSPADRGQWGFGSGRRMCPGMHVAQNTLLLAISRILWAFDIELAKDESGSIIPIERDAFVGGLAAAPAPFKCSIHPRSIERAALVQAEWDKAQKELLDSEGNYKRSVVEKKG